MILVEYIKELLLSCPYISVEGNDFHVDFVDTKPVNFSIDPMPTTTILKPYMDGSSQRQLTFQLSAKAYTTQDKDRINNNDIFSSISDWFRKISKLKQLPDMGSQYIPMKIEAIGAGYLIEREQDNQAGRYSMQCRLLYFEKG